MKLRTRLTISLAGVSLMAAGALFGAALFVLDRSNDEAKAFRVAQSTQTVTRNHEANERFLAGMTDGVDVLLARAEVYGGALTVRAAASGNTDAQIELLRLLGEEASRRTLDVLDVIAPDGRVLASAHWPTSSLTRTDVAASHREGETGYALVQTKAESGATVDEHDRPVFRIAFQRTVRLSSAPQLLLVAGIFADDEGRLSSFAGDPDVASIEAAGRKVHAAAARDPFQPPPEVAPVETGSELVLVEKLLPSFDDPDDASREVTLRIARRDDGAEARRGILLAFIAIAGVILLACFPAATVLSRRFADPIDDLAKGARAIALGDLDHRIPPYKSRAANDETTELVAAFNGMARDLKESRNKLLQTERVAAWREIAKRIAHEIKNPLTPIQMAVETTRRAHREKRADFDEILEESAQAILEEVDSLKKLVKEFSEFARMPDPVLVPDDVNDVVRGALRVFSGVPDGVQIASQLADDLPRVRLDRDQMTRVLINLVANAVDAVEGKGAVDVRTVLTRDERGDGVEIHVQDDGPGIPPDAREKIFTPYFTTKANGTGLGLAIVQRIVIDHGGDIVIAEARGRGTDFVVRLRAASGAAPRIAPAA